MPGPSLWLNPQQVPPNTPPFHSDLLSPCDLDSPTSTESPRTPGTPLGLNIEARVLGSPQEKNSRIFAPLSIVRQANPEKADLPANLEIISEIGSGSFCRTYSAKLNGVEVAVKQRMPTTHPEVISREAAVLQRLTHPGNDHVLHLIAHTKDAIVMPLYTQDAAAYVRKLHIRTDADYLLDFRAQSSPIIGLDLWLRWAGQLVNALAYVHSKGIVHGDVKPDNVLLDSSAQNAVLGDFSSATLTHLNPPASVACSAVYSAPEVRYGAPPSPGTDVYALGLILCYFATREEPYAMAKVPQQRAIWMDRMHPLEAYAPESQMRFRYIRPIIDYLLNRAPLSEVASKISELERK